MIHIILNEWRSLLRIKILTQVVLFFAICLGCVTWLGVLQNNEQLEQHRVAKDHIRQQWESIDSMNPHGAAHYGSYAFKPTSVLHSIDEGVTTVTGNVLRLEGHVQNEMVYSEVSQSLSVSKFGKLKPSLLLQYIIPLFLIFLAFGSVSKEKETGRIKLLILQGTSISKLVLAKSFAICLFGLLLLVITFATQVMVNFKQTDADSILRISLLLGSYAAYYYVIVLLTTYLSARLKSSTASLSSMLAVWMLWTIFLPKIWGSAAEKFYPLPNRQAFQESMKEDRSKGINGHNPSKKRKEELEQKILADYQVDSIEQLPINFEGVLMQKDEEYGNQVWDRHFGSNYKTLQQQKKIYQLSGFVNPFASLQNMSMGFSGTDMLHHLVFLRQAEYYRRSFIKSLNDKLAYGGSKTGDWNWKANNDFYKSVKDFNYKSPPIKELLIYYIFDLLSIAFWVLLTTLSVVFATRKISAA